MSNPYVLLTIGAVATLSSITAAQCQPYWRYPLAQPFYLEEMKRFDDGSGEALYIRSNNGFTWGIERLRADGTLEVIEQGLRPAGFAWSFITLNDGTGEHLIVHRNYLDQHANPTLELRRWNGQEWEVAWPGMVACNGPNCYGPVLSVDIGDGMTIYGLEKLPMSKWAVRRWNGQAWVEMAVANDHPKLFGFDLGDGPGLYAKGSFTNIGGVPVRGFARWTGSTWIDLGHPDFTISSGARPTVLFDAGYGPEIYTINHMYHHNQPLLGVKRWRHGIWEVVGAAVQTPGTIPIAYMDLHVFDDGTGPALYVAGDFHNINGIPARGVARYDGKTWSALGPGFRNSVLLGSATTDRGPALFVTQEFPPYMFAQWVGCPNCYANCDNSTTQPLLNVDDFMCFINEFASAHHHPEIVQRTHYANCDQSTTPPILNVDNFTCFVNKFAAGCP